MKAVVSILVILINEPRAQNVNIVFSPLLKLKVCLLKKKGNRNDVLTF